MVMPTIVAFIPAVYADALADMVSPDGRIPAFERDVQEYPARVRTFRAHGQRIS